MALSLATFNVENLLDPRTEPERARLADKIAWIARMIDACDADVIGLQEVGTLPLVRAVLDRTAAPRGWGEPVLGTADARGIRCALVARAHVPIASTRVHTAESLAFPVFRAGDPAPFGTRIPLRRGVVHARVRAADLGDVDVFVVHFKSVRAVPPRDAAGNELPSRSQRERAEGQLRAIVWRAAEALFVRGLVDDLLGADEARRADTQAQVAVVGDMNDVADSVVLRTLRGEPPDLLDCTAGVDAAQRFSCLHEGQAVQIDHVLASARLHGRLAREGGARFLNTELRAQRDGRDPRSGDGVVSDHAPLVVRFV
jgi:endonuclease/exonuclease/phosphatase family metal-dependent hydrolase